MKYYSVRWIHERPEDPIALLYEVASDNSVPRMIERYSDSTAIADSLDLAAQREPNLVNNKCLCDGRFELPSGSDFDVATIQQAEFNAAFERAQPKL